MGLVFYHSSVSLDGYVAGPNDDVERIFRWYMRGDTEYKMPGAGMTFKISPLTAELLQEAGRSTGAIVTGRRNFDFSGAWNGLPPLGVPHVVVTHQVPQEWVKPGSPFTFVTDGVDRAVDKARQIAGDKDVIVSTASIMRQCLESGLLDEIRLDLVPVLLGDGVRLFDHLGGPVDLEKVAVVDTPDVTHLRYRIMK
jgi:dihydrofolate reductase